METSIFVNLDDIRNQKTVQSDFIKDAAYIARNTSVACGIIFNLIQELKTNLIKEDIFEGDIENFLFQLKYMLRALEKDTEHLHQSMIEAGYKHLLYYQD